MRTPPALRPGDTIGIVSPSGPVTPQLEAQRLRGVDVLSEMGFGVKFGRHALRQHFYSAGTAEERISDIHQLWADPEVGMILMSQGGQTANNLLDRLDYALFREHPKIFAGISDGTTLLNAISSRAHIVTFHGPDLLFGFGRSPSAPFIENFMQTLVYGWYGNLPSSTLRTVRESKGRASGRLCGGHSNILLHTMIAGYGPDFEGSILFLEGTHSTAELDRHIHALRLAGVFDKINGLVLGHFDQHELEETLDRDISEMVLEATEGYEFPIVELKELGHNVENFIFPIGINAAIDTIAGTLTLTEPSVEVVG